MIRDKKLDVEIRGDAQSMPRLDFLANDVFSYNQEVSFQPQPKRRGSDSFPLGGKVRGRQHSPESLQGRA